MAIDLYRTAMAETQCSILMVLNPNHASEVHLEESRKKLIYLFVILWSSHDPIHQQFPHNWILVSPRSQQSPYDLS